MKSAERWCYSTEKSEMGRRVVDFGFHLGFRGLKYVFKIALCDVDI
jgi:hypothetical protein